MVFVFCTWAGGVGLVLVIPTVVVPVTQPAQGDAAVVLALKSVCGASVLVWREERAHWLSRRKQRKMRSHVGGGGGCKWRQTRTGKVKEWRAATCKLSERGGRYFSCFGLDSCFVWNGNMSALWPQTDRQADREFFQIHRRCYIPPCAHTHILCTHVYTQLALINTHARTHESESALSFHSGINRLSNSDCQRSSDSVPTGGVAVLKLC